MSLPIGQYNLDSVLDMLELDGNYKFNIFL